MDRRVKLRSILAAALLTIACDDKKPGEPKTAAKTDAAKTEPAAKTDAAKTEPAAKTDAPKPAEPTPPPDDAARAAPPAPPPAAPPAAEPAKPVAAAKTTPELEKLDETLAKLLALPDDDARDKTACAAYDTITTQIHDVRKHPPQGVDATAWQEIAERMDGLNDFAIACAEDKTADMKALQETANVRKELDALLAK